MTPGKLIEEPPLIVLPSLARELGLNEAIVLQQLYWLGQRAEGRWVQRSASEWGRALRGVFSARTVERVLAKLREAGAVDFEEVPGKPSRYRVTSARLAEGSATLAEVPPPDSGGSPSRVDAVTTEETARGKRKGVLSPAEEPVGFGTWLAKHVDECGRHGIVRSVPRAGTSYRSELARTVAGLLGEGVTLEELELASVGQLADGWMREQGHTKFENVLRKTKLGGKVDAGRAELARRESGVGRFDGGDPRA